MTGRPGERVLRAFGPVTLSAVLAAAPVWGLGAVTPAHAITPEQAAAAGYVPNPSPALARITIDELTPEVLDGDSSPGGRAVGTESGVPLITITGTITNVGDAPLESWTCGSSRARGRRRVRRRSVTRWCGRSRPSGCGAVPARHRIVAAGETVSYSVSMPARESPGRLGPDLQLTEPGVYPLLVNVTRHAGGWTPARLDDARTLLPVLDVPRPAGVGVVDDDDEWASPAGRAGSPPTAVPLTMVWPLASAPTRIAAVPGVESPDPVVMLTDGSLLEELSEAGRLTGLVRAADEAFSGPAGQELRRATCVAVDPDLLQTVSEIADGRTVLIDDGNGPVPPDEDGSRAAVPVPGWRPQSSTPPSGRCPRTPGAGWTRCVRSPTVAVWWRCVAGRSGQVARVRSWATSAAVIAESIERILGLSRCPTSSSDVRHPRPGHATALGEEGPPRSWPPRHGPTRTELPSSGMVGLAARRGEGVDVLGDGQGGARRGGSAPENPRYSDPATRYWLTADSPQARLQDARASLLAPLVDATDGGSTPVVPGTAAADAVTGLSCSAGGVVCRRRPRRFVLSSLGEQRRRAYARRPLTDRLRGPVTIPDGYLSPEPTSALDPGTLIHSARTRPGRRISG